MESSTVKKIPLNIAMDYPVNWDFVQILRELIQNFYDSIGAENFAKDFIYTYEECGGYKVELKTRACAFDFKWLTYIGGSIKTMHPGKYIGMYGEGFKMCVLNIMAGKKGKLLMESGDWWLEPYSYDKVVDDKKLQMLGYKVGKRENDGWTRLTLQNISKSEEKALKEVLLYFFYPENPLFGEKLYETEEYAVYSRSDMAIPGEGKNSSSRGVLYCNFLARATLPIDIVLLCRKDMIKSDSRRRPTMKKGEIKDVLYEMAAGLDAEASYIMLEVMREYWADMPKRLVDMDTWYYVICQLVRNIYKNEGVSTRFQNKYPELYYIEKKTADRERNRLIDETSAWCEKKKIELVNPVFRLLGANSLVEQYIEEMEKAYREPTPEEKKKLSIVFLALEELFQSAFFEEHPVVMVSDAIEMGKEKNALVIRKRETKGRGARRYMIEKIVISMKEIVGKEFEEVLILFLRLMVRAYGTERSACANGVLTRCAAVLYEKRAVVSRYAEVWNAGKRRNFI